SAAAETAASADPSTAITSEKMDERASSRTIMRPMSPVPSTAMRIAVDLPWRRGLQRFAWQSFVPGDQFSCHGEDGVKHVPREAPGLGVLAAGVIRHNQDRLGGIPGEDGTVGESR